MKLFRAMGYDELVEVRTTGALKPGPPSFQGKWFAEKFDDAVEWGRRLVSLGNPPFHVVEFEISDEDVDRLFRATHLDRIGPACFVEVDQLGLPRFVREISNVPIF